MTEKIRIGIVGATTRKAGTGWGANIHVPALRGLAEYELVAVCTAHEESARESAESFGAPLAFSDVSVMVAHPDVDLVAVVVRVPRHAEIVRLGLEAGKAVFCEWPLAVDRAEAESLAALADTRSATTAVGLQARSDPAIGHARRLLADGAIGEVLAVNLQAVVPNDVVRPAPRLWQRDKTLGATTLTIAAGHALDALGFVAGEIAEFGSRVTTRIPTWTDADTGEAVPVDAPDTVQLIGALADGAEVAAQIVAVPGAAPGYRLQAFGTTGALRLSGASVGSGSELRLRQGPGALEPVVPPGAAELAALPPGPARNVGAAYLRLASALRGDAVFTPSFGDAVALHGLLDDIATTSSASDPAPAPAR